MPWQVQESFSSGEVSPRAFPRASLQQIENGAKALQNALLTAFGAAKKRFGSRFVTFSDYQPGPDEADEPLGGEAIAIPYETTTGGKYMVVLTRVLPGDTTATLKVMEGYSYIGFADEEAHGPIPALSGTDKYNTFYALSELQDIHYFQAGNRLFILHPAHPPIVLERAIVGLTETWKYQVAPFVGTSPRIHVEGNTVALLVNTSDFEITASDSLFVPEDIGTYWRVGGTKDDSSWSEWVKVTHYLAPDKAGYEIVSGNDPGSNALDWCGPFVKGDEVAIVWGNPAVDTSVILNYPTTPTTDLIGNLLVSGPLVGLIYKVEGETVTVRIIKDGTPTTTYLYGMGTRKGVKRDYYMRASTTNDTTTHSYAKIWSTKQNWLPRYHENVFDGDDGTATRGGTVFIQDGIVAVTAEGGGDDGYRSYSIKNIDGGGYVGPTFNIGLGMSEGVGFPSVGASHQGRAVLAGFTGSQAGAGVYSENVAFSRAGDTLDFSQGDGSASDGFVLIARDGGPVRWVDSNRDFLVGCDRAEYRVNGIPITPTTAALIKTSAYGSSRVMPVRLGAASLYVSRDGTSLYMATYSDMQDTYDVADLTDLADHLFVDDTISQLAITTSPDVVVWVRTKAGKVRTLNWKPATNVMGWSRMETGANDVVDWIATRPTQTAGKSHDNVWAVIQRKYGGGSPGTVYDKTFRSIESFGEIYTMDQENTYTSTTSPALASVLTDPGDVGYPTRLNIPALTGQTVQVIADGVYLGDVTFPYAGGGGIVTSLGMTAAPTSLTVGRSIPFTVEPCIQETTVGRGPSHGLRRNISRILVYVQNTRGLVVEQYALQTVPDATPSTAIPVMGGWVTVPVIGDYGTHPNITITQTAPYPIEVCAVNMEISYGD